MAVDYQIRFEPGARRVRVELNGTLLADSRRALILHETRLPPAYYFPREDVQFALFERSAHVTHCPFKGDATYWSVHASGAVAADVAWSYEEAYADAAAIPDQWLVERDVHRSGTPVPVDQGHRANVTIDD